MEIPNPSRVSPTPAFMRSMLEAWRKDYSVAWAIHRVKEDFTYDGDPFEWVCNRPKTPKKIPSNGRELGYRARRWLARFFRPVSDALFDGRSDEDVIKLWINTDRKDTGVTHISVRKTKDQLRDQLIIRARQLSPQNGSFWRRGT